MPLSLPGRESANGHALLERHRPCLRERHPVLSAVAGHITDLETIVGRRVNRSTRLDKSRRHRSTVFATDPANPGSDSQSNSGLRKIIRKVSLEFAKFDWTRQSSLLSRPVKDCEGCPALAVVRNLSLDDPSADRPDSHCNFGDRSTGRCRTHAAMVEPDQLLCGLHTLNRLSHGLDPDQSMGVTPRCSDPRANVQRTLRAAARPEPTAGWAVSRL
jgi:hypothetical protein